jgi:hypothetical protein
MDYEPGTHSSTYSVINQWIKLNYFTPEWLADNNANQKFFNDYLLIDEDFPEVLKDNMYIDNYKNAVNIQDEYLPSSGNNYGTRPAELKAEDPYGVNGVQLLKVSKRDNT